MLTWKRTLRTASSEQVLRVESRIYRGDFSSHPLDEKLAAGIPT